MGDFTASFATAHQAELDAAYRRGFQDRNAEIAKLLNRVGELVKERQTALNALVDALYDEKKREEIRVSLEEAFGLTDAPTGVSFLEERASDQR